MSQKKLLWIFVASTIVLLVAVGVLGFSKNGPLTAKLSTSKAGGCTDQFVSSAKGCDAVYNLYGGVPSKGWGQCMNTAFETAEACISVFGDAAEREADKE